MVEADQLEEHQEKTFVEDTAILDKLKAAAAVTDAALAKACEQCVNDADIHSICQATDTFIEEEIVKTFSSKKSKNLERGIAFPTCISVNQIMGHYSPLSDESTKLKDGDVVKVICGAHIDGYAANAATTFVVGNAKVGGRQADVILAAWNAFQAAQRKIAGAGTNTDVTEVIQKIAEEFNCNAVEGVLSHKVKKHLIDGNDVIINRVTPGNNVEEFEFAPGDIIGLDVYVSSGEGKPKEADERCTVYKREIDQFYSLKSKSAREFLVEVGKRFPTLPFAIRSMSNVTGAKIGITECINHDMLVPYPVLTERVGEYVAQFKCTIVVQPRSTAVIAGGKELDVSRYQSEHSVKDEGLKSVLASDLWKKEKKPKAKK